MRLILFLVAATCASISQAGQFELADMDGVGCEQVGAPSTCITLSYSGEIKPGDSEKLLAEKKRLDGALKKLLKNPVRIGKIHFDSPGGDLFEAMKIGRIIRDGLMATQVTRDSSCYSACVIAFIGGVIRIPVGPVGIHSFYSKELIGPSEFASVSQRYDAVSLQVEQYLRAMRIPVALLDEMKSIPHYNIQVLEFEEMKRLGVIGIDPVYAQIREKRP